MVSGSVFFLFHQLLCFPIDFPVFDVNLMVSELLSESVLNFTFMLSLSSFKLMSCCWHLLSVCLFVLFYGDSCLYLLSQMSLGDRMLFRGHGGS